MIEPRRLWLTALIVLLGLALFAGSEVAVVAEEHEDENPGFMAAKGRITYGRYCANCHGADGTGNGSIAKFLKIPPTDLTQIEKDENGEIPFEDLRAVIDGRTPVRGHGSREMPIWGDVFQDPLSEAYAAAEESGEERAERMIRELIYYLGTIQSDDEPEAPARR